MKEHPSMMKNARRPASAAACCFLLALISACSTPDKPKPAPVQPVIQSPQKTSLTATDANSGASVVLERTQDLIVRLPLIATTNLEWSLVDLKPGVVTLESSKFERSPRYISAEENPGTMVFVLKPVAAGDVALKFDLRRPHRLEPATQTVTYAVTVK
jgi:predicted secreted protein